MATDPDRDLKYPNSPTSWPENVPVNADATNTDVMPLHVGDFDAEGSPVPDNFCPAYGPMFGSADYVYDNADGSKNPEPWRSATDGQPTDPEDMAPARNDNGEGGGDVAVESISLDPSGPVTLTAGDTQTVDVVFSPSDAADQSFTQSTGDGSVATTSKNGDGTFTITAVDAGSTTITVNASGQTATIDVTVEAA